MDSVGPDPTAGFSLLDGYSLIALAVGAVIAGIWAMSRGYGRDPLAALVAWCQGQGLDFVERLDEPDIIGTFRGEASGGEVTVEVRRLPQRRLADLPPQLTTVTVAAPALTGDVLLQPADWVMDVEGAPLPPRIALGDQAFAQAWSVYGDNPRHALALVTAPVRRRLMSEDTALLSIRLGGGRVSTSHPGIVYQEDELSRRVAVVSDIARLVSGQDVNT